MALGLKAVVARVAAACDRAGRDPGEIRLIAVSKAASEEQLLAAYAEGQRDFAENRADTLAGHRNVLPGDVRWHFVGPLQGNKVRRVRPAVAALHSLDREELAVYWVKGPGHPPPVFVQVNLAGEDQKFGVDPEAVRDLVETAGSLGIPVIGLSAIPPRPAQPEDSRPWFRALRRLRDEVSQDFPEVERLSMGMSADFEVAVEEGATDLRVGRAIFTEVRAPGRG